MSTTNYAKYSGLGGGSGGGVPIYANLAAFPVTATQGDLGVAADTGILYEWNGAAWVQIGGPGVTVSLGNLDSETLSAKGANLVAGVLAMQSADATHPGLVNTTSQTFTGDKTVVGEILSSGTSGVIAAGEYPFTPSSGVASIALVAAAADTRIKFWNGQSSEYDITFGPSSGLSVNKPSTGGRLMDLADASVTFANASTGVPYATIQGATAVFIGDISGANLSGTNTGDVTIGTANGLSLSSQALSLATASGSTTGALTSTDWNTFNGKQAALTIGNLTDVGTDGITITNGTGAVIGSGTSIAQQAADASHNGYLSSTDWTTFNNKGSGAVTSVSVASANGFAGSSSGGATPALTLTTTITGVLKGNATAISAATAGTDYSAGTNALSTGILKSTTTTGALTIAVAGDFPTLNQNTTGSAAKWTTARSLAGNSVDGSADVVFSNKFIVQGTADSGLSAGQFLGALSTGIIKSTTTTGVLSIAAVSDIPTPLTTKGDLFAYGSSATRLGVGGDNKLPMADSTATLGISYQYAANAKNYISNPNFESNSTTNWSLGTATLTSNLPTGVPTFGSGASGNLSLAVESSGPLAGTYSLGYVSSAATTAGNFVSTSAWTIDTEDQAKVLTFKFYYQAQTGTTNCNFSGTTSNSFGVAIYDVTNSAWVIPAGVFNIVQGTGVGYCTGTFQTASNGSQYRLCVYNANATAGAVTMYLDDFYCGPQTAPMGPAMSDWTAYTPTFTAFGTVTVQSFFWRRIGDSLQIHGRFTAGTVTAAEARVSLPPGLTSSANITTLEVVGDTVINANGAATDYTMIEPSVTYVTFGVQASGNNGLTKANGTVVCATGNAVSILGVQIPIAGWSSNTSMSNDTDTRVVALSVKKSGTQAVTANVTNITYTSTVFQDTHAGWNGTDTYTIPVAGTYWIGSDLADNSSNSYQFFVYVNGTTTGYAMCSSAAGIPTGGGVLYAGLKPGDLITIRANATQTVGTPAVLSLFRLSGPAVVAATESVNARYFASATSISGSLATVSWTTKDYDSHNAMSAGTYTIPVSGKYQINAAAATTGTFALNNQVVIEIQKNGSVVSRDKNYAGGIVTDLTGQISDQIACVAGDTVRIQLSSGATGPSIISSNFENYFSIFRTGN